MCSLMRCSTGNRTARPYSSIPTFASGAMWNPGSSMPFSRAAVFRAIGLRFRGALSIPESIHLSSGCLTSADYAKPFLTCAIASLFFGFDPFRPFTFRLNGVWHHYDTGASLAAAFPRAFVSSQSES